MDFFLDAVPTPSWTSPRSRSPPTPVTRRGPRLAGSSREGEYSHSSAEFSSFLLQPSFNCRKSQQFLGIPNQSARSGPRHGPAGADGSGGGGEICCSQCGVGTSVLSLDTKTGMWLIYFFKFPQFAIFYGFPTIDLLNGLIGSI